MRMWEIACYLVMAAAGAVGLWRAAPGVPPESDGRSGFLSLSEPGGPGGEPARYALYVPPEYDGTASYPLIVSLNGKGENGRDGRQQLKAGLAPAVWWRRSAGRPFPFFALFPQAREGWTSGGEDARLLLRLVDRTLAEYRVDPDRVYLTGVSSGGLGAWELAAASPGRWAAVVPMAATAPHEGLERLSGMPVWAFHNSLDSPGPARSAVARLTQVGGTARLTEYDQPGHDCWTQGYATDELYAWLLKQSRKR